MLKIQDLVFILVFLLAIWRLNHKLTAIIGIACLILAIPLFKLSILFTAQRLTWYAAGFFLLTIVQQFYAHRH